MEPSHIMLILVGINTLISLGTVLYNVFSSAGAQALKKVDGLRDELLGDIDGMRESLEKRLDALQIEERQTSTLLAGRCQMTEQHVAVLQAKVEQLPSAGVTARLEVALTRLEGRIDTLSERIQPVAAMANRLQEHHMETRS